ncbi:MAG TPA: hypothetical protein PKD48_15270 [Sphingopyxis sp.]|nr:hypothetical protein [Sphingopyxis sp.]HMQ19059.1 hypothetical protein [Sphingopyxis sp.]
MLKIEDLHATAADKPILKCMLPMLVVPLLAPAAALAAAPEPDRSAERIATETCVWDAVQAKLGAGAPTDDIDARLAIGRDAAEQCAPQIRKWAEKSPAVHKHGEAMADVELHITIHYVARGALFAEGRTRPFYETPPTAATFSPSGEGALHRGVRPTHTKPRAAVPESYAKEENAQNQ